VVDLEDGAPDGSGVPTIAELLASYRDRTGYSYKDMARKVRDELQASRLQQLVTAPPKAFPERRTIELLSELLEVPTATTVLAFAAGLGIPISQSGTILERTLPPGSEILTVEDREAVRVVAKALIDARRDEHAIIAAWQQNKDQPPIASPEPATVHDFVLAARRGDSEGRRLRQQQDVDAES